MKKLTVHDRRLSKRGIKNNRDGELVLCCEIRIDNDRQGKNERSFAVTKRHSWSGLNYIASARKLERNCSLPSVESDGIIGSSSVDC